MLSVMKNIDQDIFALNNFEGPLDFLLHLINKNEIDIYEVSLQKITEQYLKKLQELVSPEINSGAEFIGTTASLLHLKSRMLLPKHEQEISSEEEDSDSDFKFIHQLIEYCRFKDLAKGLVEREQKQSAFYTRGAEEYDLKKKSGIQHITLEDLANLFRGVLANASIQKGLIHEEVWRVSDKIREIRKILREESKIECGLLFSAECSRLELIVSFLAILELMKLGEVSLEPDPALENGILLVWIN